MTDPAGPTAKMSAEATKIAKSSAGSSTAHTRGPGGPNGSARRGGYGIPPGTRPPEFEFIEGNGQGGTVDSRAENYSHACVRGAKCKSSSPKFLSSTESQDRVCDGCKKGKKGKMSKMGSNVGTAVKTVGKGVALGAVVTMQAVSRSGGS